MSNLIPRITLPLALACFGAGLPLLAVYEAERQAILERREPTAEAERQVASGRGEPAVAPRSYTR